MSATRFSVLHLGEVGSPYDRALRVFATSQQDMQAARAPTGATEDKLLRAIIDGRQFGALLTTGAVAEICPRFHVGDLPYLFTSPDHARRFWKSAAAEKLKDQAKKAGIILLAFYDAGTRHFFNRVRPIKSPNDLSGLKIRTMPNRYHMRWIETLGASPVAMSTASIQTAFQDGAIDGAERSYLNYRDLQCLDVAPYFLRTQHFHLSACLAVSQTLWASENSEFRTRCEAAAAESETVERGAYAADDEAARAALVKQGLNIVEPDIDEWKLRAGPVIAAFSRELDGSKLVDAARAA